VDSPVQTPSTDAPTVFVDRRGRVGIRTDAHRLHRHSTLEQRSSSNADL